MRETWLDRAIGWVSPQRGLRRAQARRMRAALGYEAGKSGRRTEGWVTTASSADAEIELRGATMRDRARSLVRDNPYAAKALDVKVSNTIGAGIVAEFDNSRLKPIWDRFVDECDIDGRSDLYGLQALAERTRSESGDVLIRFYPGPSNGRDQVPLKLRVLEPDHIDDSRNGPGEADGSFIRHGIEYNSLQQVVAYWLFDDHPGNSWNTVQVAAQGYRSRRVEASDVLHIFRRLRPGQSRGVTEFAPVMMRMRDLDDYDDAEIMRKKIEACLAAFVTTPGGFNDFNAGAASTDDVGRVEQLFPGMIEYLRQGESIEFSDPKSSGGYADFQRFGLRAISAGYGVPYELMTGDLSEVNYSSYRAGLVEFRRRCEQDQWLVHIHQACVPVWQRFRFEARIFGRGIGDRTEPDWTPPRFELIDPLKETQADLEAVLAGFETWPEVVRRRGWTSTEQLEVIEKWQKDLEKRGIVLKSDPRSGMQSNATPTDGAAAA